MGAVVDAGSISVHLLVAAVDDHDLEPLVDESVFLRLGSRVDAVGCLGAVARAELAAALAGYAATARALGATSVAFLGTEPLRRAADAARAVAEVEAATGIALHVISHEEEARLTLLGVTRGRRLLREVVVVDVGGGSTEIVSAGPSGEARAEGLGTGSGRLTAALVAHDPPTRRELEALRSAAAARVAVLRVIAPRPDAGRAARDRRPGVQGGPGGAEGDGRELVAVGGTASNLAKVLPAAMADRMLTAERLAEAIALLLSEPSAVAAERYCLNPIRARTLPAGAAILEALLAASGADAIRVSDDGMREGAVIAAARAPRSWRDRLPRLVAGWD